MGRKFLVILIVAIVLAVGLGYYFGHDHGWERAVKDTANPSPASKEPEAENVDFEAGFVIFTDGILRSFSNPMYHYLSEEVYIGENPYGAVVKKQAVTWGDFFETLPMTLTANCLITGDGERLCNSSAKQLKFYLNDEPKLGLLDTQIQPQDRAVIIYGAESRAQIQALLERARGLVEN